VVATGSVVEDLEAIREAQVPGTYMYKYWDHLGLVPWTPPASGLAIECLKQEIPEVPDGLVDLLSVTEVPATGILDFLQPLGTNFGGSLLAYSEEVNRDIAPLSFVPSDAIHYETNRTLDNDDGWVPEGDDLAWFQTNNNDRNLGMAVSGPIRGRIYSLNSLYQIQRVSYRLSDVVACTRELYENGWFSYFVWGNYDSNSAEFEERIAELVMPTVARWHCSPRVACLVRHEEPIRPADL